MNKTIIINMNGIIFHIEEDAYELLKTYMSEVKRHFAYTTDSAEIVSDIESRIAEMFSELLADQKKQVIDARDVASITAQMGSVAEFETADDTPHTAPAEESRSSKRLFRDTDDRIIGGVCAGIGHYFSINARWIRLLFIVLTISFFIGGFAYIILWISMPKAKSRGEKMAMKGEKLNIQNFKRNFDEEVEAVRTNRVVNRAGGFFRDLFEHLFNFARRIARIALKIVCAFIILAGLAAVVALFVTLIILMGNSNLESSEVFSPMNMVNDEYRSPLYISAFIVFLIPLTALVLFAVRVLFNRIIVTRTTAFAMLVIWLTGIGIGIFYVARVASNFSEEATYKQVVTLKPAKSYVLKLDDSRLFSHEDSIKYKLKDGSVASIGGRNHFFNRPRIDIYIELAAPGELPTLTKKFFANGLDFDQALQNAQNIRYSFTAQDSLLRFAKYGQIVGQQLWREQSVSLTLKVPRGTVLFIDNALNDYINGYNVHRCSPDGTPWEVAPSLKMTEEGLKCTIDSLNKED